MDDKVKIMIAQLNPTVGALTENMDLLFKTYLEAEEKGIDLVAFPEMFLTGYQAQDLILNSSFQADVASHIQLLAGKCSGQTALLFGAPILDGSDLYNAYIMIKNSHVEIVTKKKHLPNFDIFDEQRYFRSGHLAKVFKIKKASIGCPICEDIWRPDVTRMLKNQGANLLISPNGSPYERGKIKLRHTIIKRRCLETGLPIIYINLIGGQDDQVFDGGSFVANKAGEIRVQIPQFEEKKSLVEFHEKGGLLNLTTYNKVVLAKGIAQDYRAIVEGTLDYVVKTGFESVILGLSGGIDSALVATVAVDALGPKNVTCVKLPSQFSSKGSLTDADDLTQRLGCITKTIPIIEPYNVILDLLAKEFQNIQEDLTEENLQSRIRGMILMALSNKFGSMLLTTGNKSEIAVGYSTIYGDMCGGYNPIKDIFKTRLYDLCRWRNTEKELWMKGPSTEVIPKTIIDKPPSAELRPDQKDQDTLPPYDILDKILEGLIEKNLSTREIARSGIDISLIKKVEKLVYSSEYKRFQSAPGVHITKGSFWLSRRYPLVQHWRDPS
ncbi:MAG: NAD+ synthase [Rhodobacteraceae bacterium]|nr:NAD+ synthase [Paracoccaceae bacterium]